MDVICCRDMSDFDSLIVNLKLPVLISALEFKMVLINCFSTVISGIYIALWSFQHPH